MLSDVEAVPCASQVGSMLATIIVDRFQPHDSGVGKVRWVVERTHAWLHGFHRLRTRFECRADKAGLLPHLLVHPLA